MSDNKENISAYLDDSLGQAEHLDSNAETAQTLRRYSMIGDAMRGEVNEATMLDVSQQVRQAIANESLAATEQASKAAAVSDKGSWFNLSSWLQPVGGLAIAASVAMIAVVTLDQTGDAGSGINTQVIAESAPTMTADMAPAPVKAVASNREVPALNPAASEFNLEQYLDEHSEFAASDTLQGRLPYVRAVGYKTRTR